MVCDGLYNLNMDKQDAIVMRDHGVKAIRELMDLLISLWSGAHLKRANRSSEG